MVCIVIREADEREEGSRRGLGSGGGEGVREQTM